MGNSPDDKISQLEKLMELDSSDPTGWFMLGKLYLDAGRHAEAAAAFQKAIKQDPDYSAAYRMAGDAYRLGGNVQEARATYEKGIEVAERRGDLQTMKEMKVFLGKL